MTIKTTASKLIHCGQWDAYCAYTGTSVWVVNEGQMDGTAVLEISVEAAAAMGLLVTPALLWVDAPERPRTAI